MLTNIDKERVARLKELFSVNKKKQSDVAKAVGVSRSAVSKWLSGDNVPAGKYLDRLARVLDTTPDYIIKGVSYIQDDAVQYVNQVRESIKDDLIFKLNLDKNVDYDIDLLEELYIEDCDSKGLDGKLKLQQMMMKAISSESEDNDSTYTIKVDSYVIKNEGGKDRLLKDGSRHIVNVRDVDEAGAEYSSVICVTNNDMLNKDIAKGSKCLVDQSKTEIKDGMTYLIKAGALIVIRKIYRNFDGTISLRTGGELGEVTLKVSDLEILGWVFSYTTITKWN